MPVKNHKGPNGDFYYSSKEYCLLLQSLRVENIKASGGERTFGSVFVTDRAKTIHLHQ